MEEINELQKLIDDFNSLNIKERKGITFLEIAKAPHLENVWSNILAFYINPNREHKLHDLLLKSFFQKIENAPDFSSNWKSVFVETEYRTEKGNRIDIVVKADNYVLGIENKIEAELYNDLADYSNTIDNLAKGAHLPTYKIVLSKYANNKMSNGFVNITYSELIKSIRNNLGIYTDYADSKYLIFLLDFLKNIEKNINSNNMEENKDVIQFLQNNTDKVQKLIKYHKRFNESLIRKMTDIDKLLITETKLKNIPLVGEKNTTGRFTWNGHELAKYTLKVNGVVLTYQIGVTPDYRLQSHYWFAEAKYKFLEAKLIAEKVTNTFFDYEENNVEIVQKIEAQLKTIIDVLNKN